MYNKTVLSNGVRIVSERFSHSRIISVGIWVDVGSRDEHDLNNGCAHFVEHMLFKGTADRSAQQISREFDALGGTANAFTSRENTCYYATVLDNHLPKLVELLSDIFLNSQLSDDEIDKECQVIHQEINMVEDIPDDHIHDLFAAQLWGMHPLGKTVLGAREVISSMDSKKLRDYIAQHYQPEKILIAAAGNIDHETFVELCESKFSKMSGNGDDSIKREVPVTCQAKRTIYHKPLEQTHIILGTYGLSNISPDRYAYLLLNTIFGGNMSSRVYQEIREKRGLAYSVYSYIASYMDSGYMATYLGIDHGAVNKAFSLIQREISKISAEPVTEAELDNAKEFIKGGLYLSAENMESIMTRIARNEMAFNRYISLDEVATEINKVNNEDICRLAENVFKNNDLTVAAVGPLSSNEIDWNQLG